MILSNATTRIYFGQKAQNTQQSNKVLLNKTQVSCEGSEGSALVTVACKASAGSVFRH